MPDKKEKPKRIFGVSVNRAEVKKASDLEGFKKVNPDIFSHLSEEDQATAYSELYAEYTTKAPAAATSAAQTSKPVTSTTQDPAKP